MKKNESTLNRPDGERVIDAPYVFTDIHPYISQLKKETAWQKSDRNAITVFKTETLTQVIICLHQAARIEDNAIDGIVTVLVLDGQINVITSIREITVSAGQMLSLHPGIHHTIEAWKESSLLLIKYEGLE